jgi:hypothetical protein
MYSARRCVGADQHGGRLHDGSVVVASDFQATYRRSRDDRPGTQLLPGESAGRCSDEKNPEKKSEFFQLLSIEARLIFIKAL